ncbi:IucA/IucC family protein [Crossiella cryophila]|uniref:Aerobactin synthase n=1 Tax=Crossiella cryophila TaxID=43355 RepID=A0A7W7CHH9_9PSEU|nr:IucA/IucC family protein [Crossiella cryophila]MBB4681328.1 aerobactin synthase [Crossiella cryophila]
MTDRGMTAGDTAAGGVGDRGRAAWRAAGKTLVAKAIAEFCYEELLTPTTGADQQHLDFPAATYTFTATRGAFGAWRVAEDSIRRQDHAAATIADGGPPSVPAEDPLLFLTDARTALGLDGPTLAEALRDLTATWTADAHLLATQPTAAGLAELSYAELESWQQGHPCILLNKGRLGFSAADTRRYAPEHRQHFRLPWLAVHRELAAFAAVPGLSADTLLAEELDPATRQRFAARLEHPADYVWLPVHPFHLENAVRPLFAQQLAEGRIVELGEAPDHYRALASVRTLVNVDHPHKRNVKLALLIRNTLVWRGLPAESAAQAPEVTRWLHLLPHRDPYLAGRMDLLGEVASVAVHHPGFAAVPDAPYRYHELLGAIWREPATGYLAEGERARSLATLLLTGADGRALIAELVERSTADARTWLAAFLRAVLPGLLHALHGNGIAFCPHGENTLVVYGPDELPRRIMLKDFAEDVKLRTEDLPGYADLAEPAKAVLLRWRPDQLAHSILSAMFTGHFRFLTPILDRHLGVGEDEFWGLVRAELLAYRARFPELAAQHEEYGFTAPEFDRVSLNREQLTGGGFHDRAEKDENFDVIHRTVRNPLCANTSAPVVTPPSG